MIQKQRYWILGRVFNNLLNSESSPRYSRNYSEIVKMWNYTSLARTLPSENKS